MARLDKKDAAWTLQYVCLLYTVRDLFRENTGACPGKQGNDWVMWDVGFAAARCGVLDT
jgi:hypothetical protein